MAMFHELCSPGPMLVERIPKGGKKEDARRSDSRSKQRSAMSQFIDSCDDRAIKNLDS